MGRGTMGMPYMRSRGPHVTTAMITDPVSLGTPPASHWLGGPSPNP